MMNPESFNQRLIQRFGAFQPEVISIDKPRAAVLVPLVLSPEPSVLLTVRASHLNSHPGQVSFPGGMFELEDASLIDTALRETFEEIALPKHQISVVGQLSTAFSKDGVQVYPIVGTLPHAENSKANPDEIAEIFSVPWSYFVTQTPKLQKIDRHGISFEIPHYYYEGRHIWGLTAMILLELINLVEDTQWPVPDFSKATRPGETP
jgi:8-oxo-dGTP pyrophosphatase MutT (NUDIX family)